jgi:hypothetical protein
VPPRRREVELSVERPLGPGPDPEGVVRLTARFDTDPSGARPDLGELKSALEELVRDLDALVGPAPPVAARAERGLAELVETYRPRQRELIDLLHDEGELTDREHALLATHLPSTPVPPVARTPPPAPAAATPPEAERPRAVPVPPPERGLPAARPVPELLRLYQIGSLRQAGAVRARRQISFAEYMALKRHFESSDSGTADERSPPRSG